LTEDSFYGRAQSELDLIDPGEQSPVAPAAGQQVTAIRVMERGILALDSKGP